MKRNFLSKQPGAPQSKPNFGVGNKISTQIQTTIFNKKETDLSDVRSKTKEEPKSSIKFEVKKTFLNTVFTNTVPEAIKDDKNRDLRICYKVEMPNNFMDQLNKQHLLQRFQPEIPIRKNQLRNINQ